MKDVNLKAGEFNIDVEEETPIWMDCRRWSIFAIPLPFTKYYLTPSRIIIESGIINSREDEIRLYRIRDISVTQTFIERLNKTGTLHICSVDAMSPEILIKHVTHPRKVKEALSQAVEKSRKENGIRTSEIIGGHIHDDEPQGY